MFECYELRRFTIAWAVIIGAVCQLMLWALIYHLGRASVDFELCEVLTVNDSEGPWISCLPFGSPFPCPLLRRFGTFIERADAWIIWDWPADCPIDDWFEPQGYELPPDPKDDSGPQGAGSRLAATIMVSGPRADGGRP